MFVEVNVNMQKVYPLLQSGGSPPLSFSLWRRVSLFLEQERHIFIKFMTLIKAWPV